MVYRCDTMLSEISLPSLWCTTQNFSLSWNSKGTLSVLYSFNFPTTFIRNFSFGQQLIIPWQNHALSLVTKELSESNDSSFLYPYILLFIGLTMTSVKSLNILNHILVVTTVLLDRRQHHSYSKMAEIHIQSKQQAVTEFFIVEEKVTCIHEHPLSEPWS
jgi:hypothetical protein